MHTDTPVSAKRKLQTERSYYDELDAGMWRYHANRIIRIDARRSQFDLGRVVAYI